MKENVFYGKGMGPVKKDYSDLYEAIVGLNEAVYTGKALDYKTQKLIALGIVASSSDDRAVEKQIQSLIDEFDTSKEELVDVLRVVLLTSGMPQFIKAIKTLYEVID